MAEINKQNDQLIRKLLNFVPGTRINVNEKDIYFLCDNVEKIFKEQNMLVELNGPVIV